MNNMTQILYMFLLAPERASKLGEPLGRVSHVYPARKSSLKSLIDQVLLDKMALLFFCVFQLASTSSLFIKKRKKQNKKNKKKTLCQYPAILTSCLVNNAYTALEVSFEWSHHRIPLVQAHKLLSHLTIRHYLCWWCQVFLCSIVQFSCPWLKDNLHIVRSRNQPYNNFAY